MSDNSNAIDKLSKEKEEEAKKIKEEIQELHTKSIGSNAEAIVDYIALGKSLVNARVKIGSQLLKTTLENIMSDKQIDRAMLFVLKNGVKFRTTKDEDLGIQLDLRVLNLTVDELKKCKNLSKNKINIMKQLNDKEFNLVVSGDDTFYKEKVSKIKEDAEKEIDKKLGTKYTDLKTKKITKDQYVEYYTKPSTAIMELVTQMENVETLSFDNELLQKEINTLKSQLVKAMGTTPASKETVNNLIGSGLDIETLNKAQAATV